jgi:hypothetical protein
MLAGMCGGVLSGLVHKVLIDDPHDMRVPVSGLGGLKLDLWRRALDTLLADPQAVIPMDDLLPPPPTPRPPG